MTLLVSLKLSFLQASENQLTLIWHVLDGILKCIFMHFVYTYILLVSLSGEMNI